MFQLSTSFWIPFSSFLISLTLSDPLNTTKPWIPSRIQALQEYFDLRHQEYLTLTQNKSLDIRGIFLGDSITEGWKLFGREYFDAHFGPLGIFNYGIISDKTQNVLWRIQNGEFDGLKDLRMVALMIGTNNLSFGDKPYSIFKGIKAIIKQLQKRMVKRILLLSVLPRNPAELDFKVHELNAKISTLADEKTIFWLDLTDDFETGVGKQIPDLFMNDLVHLSKTGYEVWGPRMLPEVKKLLTDHSRVNY